VFDLPNQSQCAQGDRDKITPGKKALIKPVDTGRFPAKLRDPNGRTVRKGMTKPERHGRRTDKGKLLGR